MIASGSMVRMSRSPAAAAIAETGGTPADEDADAVAGGVRCGVVDECRALGFGAVVVGRAIFVGVDAAGELDDAADETDVSGAGVHAVAVNASAHAPANTRRTLTRPSSQAAVSRPLMRTPCSCSSEAGR